MICFPNAKINVGLFITSRLPDGYHTLETLFYPVPWRDILEIIPVEKNISGKKAAITITGKIPEGHAADNLCIKAYHLLDKIYSLPPVEMYLHKQIPSGAGLGGGSSDAAHTLKMLNQLFELKLDNESLKKFALSLGADCPFFIDNKPAFAHSKGELLTPAPDILEGNYLVLVKPPVNISTAYAYSLVKPKPNPVALNELVQVPKESWKEHINNDFEEKIFEQYPLLSEIKNKLYQSGAWYASMSGSGSCMYGLFEKKPDVTFDDYPEQMLCRL